MVNTGSSTVLGRQLAVVSAQGHPDVNWSRLEGAVVRQEAELGTHLALELAEVRRDRRGLTPQAEAVRTMDSSTGILDSGPLCRLLSPDSTPHTHNSLVVKEPLQTPFLA